jgi:flagellar protein FlaG
MEIGGVNRPAVTSSQATMQRVDPPASSGFARTQLSRDASVQPVEEASAVRFEPRDDSNQRAAIDAAMQRAIERAVERKTDVDPRTSELVYQTLDTKSGEVLRQVPDEALLRIRAYTSELRAAQERGSDASSAVKA